MSDRRLVLYRWWRGPGRRPRGLSDLYLLRLPGRSLSDDEIWENTPFPQPTPFYSAG